MSDDKRSELEAEIKELQENLRRGFDTLRLGGMKMSELQLWANDSQSWDIENPTDYNGRIEGARWLLGKIEEQGRIARQSSPNDPEQIGWDYAIDFARELCGEGSEPPR